jgi:hypothetical protein
VGFRNPAWDDPSWPLGGSSVTVQVWRNVTKAQALANADIETREQALRYGDKPVGGLRDAKYIVLSGAAGPPVRLAQTTIAGLPALVAGVPTRLYHGNATESSGYAGAADGKLVFLIAPHAYALLYATIAYNSFTPMAASFRFTR